MGHSGGADALVSDRCQWLSLWCPECRAAPGPRCRRRRWETRRPARHLHAARGWHERRCPTCKAWPDEPCRTPSGREASQVHSARLWGGRDELLWGAAVWEELEQRGATMAIVPSWGRAGRGGTIATITLSRVEDGALVDVERWSSRDELNVRAGSAGLGSVRGVCRTALHARRGDLDGRGSYGPDRRPARRSAI